jgi:ATP-dependent helicase/nuclease subunit B
MVSDIEPQRPSILSHQVKRRLEVSSAASKRLQLAVHWIQSFPADTETLIIAHSPEAASDLNLHAVDSKRALFGIKRFTLNAFAARLAQPALAAVGYAPASSLSFTAVVARAIHSLKSDGKLSYFEPVASRPGFPVAVARTLEELRMNEVASESLAQLDRGGGDLSAIARLVEHELRTSKLADRAAIFRTAIDSFMLPENANYPQLPLLLFDVSLHSRLEKSLVEELVGHSPDVLATAPHGDEQTICALSESLQCQRANDPEPNGFNSLSRAQQFLFEDSSPPATPLDASLTLQNWPGEPRECVEIVRSIQAEAAQGVPFDQMAVLLNYPGEYRSHLEEAFSRAEIPAYFTQGTTAPDPAGRAMLALLSCAVEGLSARGFAEYLSLGQVPDAEAGKGLESEWVPPRDELVVASDVADVSESETETPLSGDNRKFVGLINPDDISVIEGHLRAPARWEQLLVDSAVIGGKDRWVRRLAGLANELRLRIEEIADEEGATIEAIKKQLRDLDALRSYALPLIERLDRLPPKANWDEWLVHLRSLATNALRDADGVLETLADLEQMGKIGPVDLHEVQLVLGPRLHDLAVKPAPRRYGSVFVGSVEAARGLCFQVVFIPGLAERMFPRKLIEDPILTDRQREEIAGVHLRTRPRRLELERLALRIALGAACDRAYLSYPRIDVQQSRPRVPSFYALETLRAAEGVLPGFEELAARAESVTRTRLGWPAPADPWDGIDEAEYDLALLASLVEEKKEVATGRAHYLLTANKHLARALRARTRRWLRRWTPNDGLVDPDELTRQSVASHQFSARSFSATALQNYAICPYRFFLSTVLRLELRQEPAAIESMDPLTRGSLFHETQFEVLTALRAAGLLPLTKDSLREAFDLVDKALDRLARDYEDTLAPAIPRVWRDSINSIKADLREWLRRMAETEDGWTPEKFELSFGLTDRGPRSSDPDSAKEPVEVLGDLRLRGSIDLVERHFSGKFRVTDHKTGKARAARDTIVGGGKHLQPLLYALACEKLLGQKVESGRLYYCTADGGYEERIVPLNEDSLQKLSSVLIAVRESLADGFLPAAPEDDACVWCDFLAVCGGFEEVRTRIKPKDRLVQLKGLRELP